MVWVLFSGPSHAELGQGTVSALLLNVDKTVGGQTTPAVVGDVIQNSGQLVTQGGSLAELSFPDGSKIRVGNNSVFSFDANQRTVTLERGTALVCTPPKAEGINVVSGGVSGTIPGDPAGKTFMITAYPPEAGAVASPGPTGGFGVLVVQGNSATTVSSPSGSVNIGPGQFALIGSKAGEPPKVFNVDVGQVYRSSPLINAFPAALPTAGAILQTATQQQATIRTGGMNSTGTVGLAVATDGTILTGASKPKSTAYTFTMASSVVGTGQERNATAQERPENISTAAGGGGGAGNVTGFAGGPGRFGRFTTPGLANVPANQPPAGPRPLSASALVTTKVYDGTDSADLTQAAFTRRANNVSLVNDRVGTFASKNVGVGIPVSTAMSILGSGASLYNFTTPTLLGTITAKDLSVFHAAVTSREYDGTFAAAVTGASLADKAIGTGTPTDGLYFTGENVNLVNTAAGTFASRNAGTWTVSTTMGLAGVDIGNYTLSQPALTGIITVRPIQLLNPLVTSIEYNGSTGFSVTRLLGSFDLNNIVGAEELNVTGNGTITGTADVGRSKFTSMTYTLGNGANGGLAGNYLPLADDIILLDITEKTLSYANPTAASKVYDGTAGATVTLGSVQGLVGTETLVIGETSSFNNKNVGTGKTVSVNFNLANGSNGGKASNYRLNGLSLSADITAKPVDVDMTAALISKAYNGTASVTVTGADLGRIAVGSGTPSDGLAYTGDTVGLAANPAVTLQRELPGSLIPVIGTGFSLTGADAGNYTLRQPTGLTGEITGSVTLDRHGAALNLSSGQYLHLRNTTANRIQDGLSIVTTSGQILVENSTFNGWMKSDNSVQVINGATGTTVSFHETANVAVASPVLRVKMEASTAAGAPGFMLLGDYQIRLQRDPDANSTTANSVGATLFTFPGVVDDPAGIGSLAPAAELVLRDPVSPLAFPELRNITYDALEYSSTLNGSGEAVPTANYAPVRGEFIPDSPVQMSDLDIPTSAGGAAGDWNVILDQPVISGEGQVTDVRLKYNNNTRALIESPDGVRLVNVVFEGMDQVDVRTAANLDNRVLMSGTLVSDPNVSKMIVQVGQKLEAHFNSDATLAEVTRRGADAVGPAGDAVIMAGVREKAGGGLEFVPGSPDRVLEMQKVNVAGQLSLAAATVVFNNANVTSSGVIQVSTRNGVVNRSYGKVVPGAVSFIGANGNVFVNRNNGNPITMRIDAGPVNTIANAFNQGHLSDTRSVSAGGNAGTVMSVGKVQ